MDLLITLAVFVVLMVVGYTAGSRAEKKHYASIREREEKLRGLLLVPSRTPPDVGPCATVFVHGSVVIGMDYFKMAYSRLLNLFGGRITPFESLVERARREAILRMKEDATAKNARFVCNVKFVTADIMSGKNNKKGGGCVEVVAYGTAIIPR